MIDRELAREIKRATPKLQDRDAYFSFIRKVRDAKKDMSTPEVCRTFEDMLRKHGRVVTAIVVAATLYQRRERLDGWGYRWATDVLGLWAHTRGHLEDAAIEDGLHPTRICEYAGSFIRLSTDPDC